jgi:sec-independent protein translocase protein TatC
MLFFAGGFFLSNRILGLVVNIFKMKDITIVTTSPFQFIGLAVDTGIAMALLFCLPLTIYHFYDFIKEGLMRRERRLFLTMIPIGTILFIIGFIYGFVTLYFALQIIAQVNVSLGVINLWDIGKFLSEIVVTSALLGVLFEFPIVITFLIRTNIVSRRFLIEKRRHAYAAIMILVSLLPPTDGVSLIVMSVPLVLIYEITIMANAFHKVPLARISSVDPITIS